MNHIGSNLILSLPAHAGKSWMLSRLRGFTPSQISRFLMEYMEYEALVEVKVKEIKTKEKANWIKDGF